MTDRIGVQIAQEFLELFPNTTVNVRLANPIFNSGNIIPGEYSLPFEVPGAELSPKNARLLKNPDVIENKEAFRKVESTLFFSGIPFKKGKVLASGVANQNRYSLNYIFGISTISDDFKTKKLRDVLGNLGGVLYTDQLVKRLFCKPTGSATTPYKLKVNGQTFESNTLDGLRAEINSKSEELGVLAIHNTFSNTSLGVTPPFLQLSPFNPNNPTEDLTHTPEVALSVAPVEDTEEEKNKWYIEAYDQTDYHNQIKSFLSGFLTSDPFSQSVRFPFVWNDRTYGDQQFIQPNNCVNGQSDGEIVVNDANWGITHNSPFEVSNQNTIQPFLRLKYLLDRIAAVFDFQWEGDWYADHLTEKMLIWNTFPLTFPLDYVGSKKYLFLKKSFLLQDLVPADITVVDFLKALQNRYNLAIYLNQKNGKIRIQKRKTIWGNYEYQDITPMSSPVRGLKPLQIKGLTLKALKEDNDIYAFDDEVTIGSQSELTIPANCAGVKENRSGYPYLPTEQLTGPVFGHKSGDKFILRIFYDKGMISSGTSDYYAALNNGGDYEETFGGSDGIHSKLYQEYVRSLIKMKEIEVNVSYEYRHLLAIDYELRTRYDRNDYYIKEINVTLTNNGISCKATLAWI